MSLSHDLYWSFIRYQTMIKREFEVMAKRHSFIELDGEASVSSVNKQLAPPHRRTASAFAPQNTLPVVRARRTSGVKLLRMSEPVHIAAIDAGSNAVRLSVARAYSALDIEPSTTSATRCASAKASFCATASPKKLFKKGVKAFCHFKEVMDDFGVTKYRAVATSASREARNRDAFLRRLSKKSGISLEVISATEESRLGREAVIAALGPEAPPRCIVDLGGGSLEISILRDRTVEQSAHLGVGTVRLDDHPESFPA